MNYHEIEKCSVSNGSGNRAVLYVSGCENFCDGCQNPETWDENSGQPFDEKAKEQLFEVLDHSYIAGLTLSGGDPLFPSNREPVTELVKEVKDRFPDKNIWLYTGYTMEQIKDLPVLSYVDVIVDGRFEIDKRDITLASKGSSNQMIWKKSGGQWTSLDAV